MRYRRRRLPSKIVPGEALRWYKYRRFGELRGESADETTRRRYVRRSLLLPSQIAENSGKEGAVVVNDILKSKPGLVTTLQKTEMGVDMVKAGIDPTKVTRTAAKRRIKRDHAPHHSRRGHRLA